MSKQDDRSAEITHKETRDWEVKRGGVTKWAAECKAQVSSGPVKSFTIDGRIMDDRAEAISSAINAAHRVVDTYNSTGRWTA